VTLKSEDLELAPGNGSRMPDPAPNFRHPTAASHVAAVLRRMIVGGELPDGVWLPRQEDLLAQFGVSHPSLREALRMLEAEGLVTVQRGNRGGAVVHSPDATCAAFTIGLVLERERTTMRDVAATLASLEVECGVVCAEAPDRNERIVPALERLNEQARQLLDDPVAFAESGRLFHEAMRGLTGSQTLKVLSGALAALWVAQMSRFTGVSIEERTTPGDCASAQRAHEAITTAIAEGDSERVRTVIKAHRAAGGAHWIGSEGPNLVDVTTDGLEAIRRSATSGFGGPRWQDRRDPAGG
jgi:GntR family transcriptional regulator, transcriptional repressor for pyruvate dehydrogenase complex